LDEIAVAEADLKLKKSEGIVGASDHLGFYQRGVPCLHFFTGLTNEYHTPQDDFETINVEGVVRAVDVGEKFVLRLVDVPERPAFVKGPSRPAAGGMAYLGITPDYTAGVQGLRIAAVAADSPASQGGLQVGDLIVQFGETPIAELKQLMDGLRRNKPGDMVRVTVRRGEDTRVSTVTLGQPPGS
jgi:membrane-associated protease RseP (regulator of RpoE activity)